MEPVSYWDAFQGSIWSNNVLIYFKELLLKFLNMKFNLKLQILTFLMYEKSPYIMFSSDHITIQKLNNRIRTIYCIVIVWYINMKS